MTKGPIEFAYDGDAADNKPLAECINGSNKSWACSLSDLSWRQGCEGHPPRGLAPQKPRVL